MAISRKANVTQDSEWLKARRPRNPTEFIFYCSKVSIGLMSLFPTCHVSLRHCTIKNNNSCKVHCAITRTYANGGIRVMFIWFIVSHDLFVHMFPGCMTVPVSVTWWRHQKDTFSASPALCEGNPSVPGGFPSQRRVTRSFDVFCDLCLNKRLSRQSKPRWFDAPLLSL